MSVGGHIALTPIDDPADSRIEVFRDIRERDLVGRGGFIAEGAVVLDQLLASSFFQPTALLVLRNRLAGLMPRLAGLRPGVPVYVAERAVFDAVAGFPVHRGVMAHAVRRPEKRPLSLPAMTARGALFTVAAGISNHDNMGAIFRNAAAFGVDAVILDETSCDPLYRKAIRVSVGSVLRVPFIRLGAVEQIVEELEGLGVECLALAPGASVPLQRWRPAPSSALFLGAEGEGLPPAVWTRMKALRIEMAPGLDSLNVAHCAAIALHHAFLHRSPPAR
ncbi:TrmH family RNA methyltransferase [Aureimonas populi]|uniref:TrmH family RNA methyltransferase n=1 Tax=Aureimonas populi TaxID=1701758 RepID=A0ABW5CGN5_9HYPH|nr:RNA methyltransferase [Aureimonas populi]